MPETTSLSAPKDCIFATASAHPPVTCPGFFVNAYLFNRAIFNIHKGVKIGSAKVSTPFCFQPVFFHGWKYYLHNLSFVSII